MNGTTLDTGGGGRCSAGRGCTTGGGRSTNAGVDGGGGGNVGRTGTGNGRSDASGGKVEVTFCLECSARRAACAASRSFSSASDILIGDWRGSRSRRCTLPITAFFETPRRRPMTAVERPAAQSARKARMRSCVQSVTDRHRYSAAVAQHAKARQSSATSHGGEGP